MISRRLNARMTIVALTSAATVMGFASTALAVPDYVKAACKADYKKFCPDYKIGSSELRACMTAIAHQISNRCYDALERSGEAKKR